VPTDRQINEVAKVLGDSANAEMTAEEVAEACIVVLEGMRQREWKYVVIAQERSLPAHLTGRTFHPTWVIGPFYTASEAGKAARDLRKASPDTTRVMGAEVVPVGQEVVPDKLKEVLL